MTRQPGAGFGKKREPAPAPRPGFSLPQFFTTSSEDDSPGQARNAIILAVCAVTLLLGGLYFFHVLLAFRNALIARGTEVLGPYPVSAVIYITIPLFFSLLYWLTDFVRVRTGLHPLKSLPGLGATAGICLVLFLLAHVPGLLIGRMQRHFAAAQGYVSCVNQFDPAHLRVYALESYVSAYGCPTVSFPPAN